METPLLLQIWFLPDEAFPRMREQPRPELTRWAGRAGALFTFISLFFFVTWQPPLLCLAPFLIALLPFVLLLEPGALCSRGWGGRCTTLPIASMLEKRGIDREAVERGIRTLSAWSDTLFLIPALLGFLTLIFPQETAGLDGAYRLLFSLIYFWRGLIFFYGLAAYFQVPPRTLWRFYLPSYLFLAFFLLLIALFVASHLLR